MSYLDGVGNSVRITTTTPETVESERNEILAVEVDKNAPKHAPMPADLGDSSPTTPIQTRAQTATTAKTGAPELATPKAAATGSGAPEDGTPLAQVLRTDTPKVASGGQKGAPEPFRRLPSMSRSELADLIRNGDKPIVYEGNTFLPSDLDRLQQSVLQQRWDVAAARQGLPDVVLRGDDRLLVLRRHDGTFAEMTLAQADAYAKQIQGDHSDLAETIMSSVKETRASDKPQRLNATVAPKPTNYDRKSFDAECANLTIGKNDDGRPLSKREELARGWAIFDNARSARPQFEQSGFIAFGRLRETSNTGSAKFGYTSEYDNGAVFKPEDWSIFINNCWVMGGIKGGSSFASISELLHAPRGKGSDLPEDFRSDGFDSSENPPLHFVTVVTAGEITALKEFGYKAVDHPLFGTMLVPDPSPEAMRRRDTATFTELQLVLDRLRVGQSIENLMGDDRIAPDLLAFIRQDPKSRDHEKGMIQLRSLIADIHKSGISKDDPKNQAARNEVKIANALRRLAALEPAQGKTPAGDVKIRIEAAWYEMRNCVLAIADGIMKTLKIDGANRDVVRLALVMDIENKRRTETFDLKSGQAIRSLIQSWMPGLSASSPPSKIRSAKELHGRLNGFKKSFEQAATTAGRKDELPTLWDQFKLAIASVHVKHRLTFQTPLSENMEGHAKVFLQKFDYIPSATSMYVPDPYDGFSTSKL